MIADWVAYDVDENLELYVAGEFTGSLTEAEKEFPDFLVRHKIYT